MGPIEPHRARRFRQCEVLLLVVALAGAAASIQYAIHQARLPYEMDYEEGNVLNAGLLIASGGTPYPDPQVLPVFNAYTPLFYEVVAFFIRQFGVQFAAPRMNCIGLGIAAAAMVSALVWRFTRNAPRSIIFGALFLILPTTQYWLPILRVDLLALALALAGTVLIAYQPHRWYAAAPLFVAALYTKQTFAAAPAACFVYFLHERRWRAALGLGALIATLSALVFWGLQTRSGGLFAWHMLRDHPQPWSLRQFGEVIGVALPSPDSPYWAMAAVILPLHGIVALLAWEGLRRNWKRVPLVAFYMLFSLAVPLVTIPKGGSATNHLLETVAVACVCASLGYSYIADRVRERPALVAFPIALAILTAGLAVAWRIPGLNQPSTALLRDCDSAYRYVRNHPGRNVLSENLGALVLGGKPVLVSPYLLNQIVRYGNWTDGPLVSSVRERNFDIILLARDIHQFRQEGSEAWSPAVLNTIEQNYVLTRNFECRYAVAAYEPKRPATGELRNFTGLRR